MGTEKVEERFKEQCCQIVSQLNRTTLTGKAKTVKQQLLYRPHERTVISNDLASQLDYSQTKLKTKYVKKTRPREGELASSCRATQLNKQN